MIDYVLVIVAVVLFSVQFFFHQQYERRAHGGLFSVAVFGAVTGFVAFVSMWAIAGFRLCVTPFSLAIAALRAVNSVLYSFAALKALGRVNLSVFTLFAMLGGMALPLVVGVFAYGEQLSVFGWIGCALVLVSLAFTMKRGEGKKSGLVFYAAVFVTNGMSGVWAKIHQSTELPHMESAAFLSLSSLLSCLVCALSALVIALVLHKREQGREWLSPLRPLSALFAGGYGVINGVANFLLLLSLVRLPAAVQYPLVTGGVIVGGTAISLIRREKPAVRELLSTLVALAATVFLAF